MSRAPNAEGAPSTSEPSINPAGRVHGKISATLHLMFRGQVAHGVVGMDANGTLLRVRFGAVHAGLAIVSSVSVAMAIHNGARFLEEQLRSLVEQSRRPDEVVVCDDASTDRGAELCAAILEGSGISLVVLRNAQSIGPYASFSRALSATRGDYVCLCDQDDVWYPEKIAATTRYLSRHPEASAVVHDVDICRSDLSPVGQSKFERLSLLGLPHDGNVTGMSTVTRRDVIDAAFPLKDPSAASHDAWLHWIAAHLGERRVLATSLAAFRRHEQNVTRDLLVNRGERVDRKPLLHSLRQIWRARDAGSRLKRARRLVGLKSEWLEAARAGHLVPDGRIDVSLAEVRETLRALDTIEAISSLDAPSRWLRSMARAGELKPFLGRLGSSTVVGALLFGSRERISRRAS